MSDENFEVDDATAVDQETGTAENHVRFDGTMTKFDSEGRRVLTDQLDTDEKLVVNPTPSFEELSGDDEEPRAAASPAEENEESKPASRKSRRGASGPSDAE